MPSELLAKLANRLPRDLSSLPPARVQTLLAAGVFVGAAGLAGLAAWASALAIESRTSAAIQSRLLNAGLTWVDVRADGLQLHLTGTAPNEAARFRAVNLAGSVIDSARVRDGLDVAPVKAIEAPTFSLEILRNDDGIQLIGLLPAAEDPEAQVTDLVAQAEALNDTTGVSNMIETAAYPAPDGWRMAYDFGLQAMRLLPRSKISIADGRVEVRAIADSAEQQRALSSELAAARPQGLSAVIDISAPRPVLTPFTFRFVKDAQGARFDACSADTERARDRILAAGTAAGIPGRPSCTVGLGVPSPSWAEAVGRGIAAVSALGAGTITFSDADVSLIAASSVSQSDFDRVVGELQAALPEVFSLTATLERTEANSGPAEFTAALAEGGAITLRGRLTDALLRDAVDSYARAQFGMASVQTLTRLDESLPDGWPVRVLAGLEALSLLAEGNLLVRADLVEVRGVTGSQAARDRISQILSNKLGQGQTFRVDVRYDEALDPLAALPTPEECAARIATVLADRKITFPPGSAEIDGPTAGIMDALAQILLECPAMQMEIAGHTDSQGSEGGNQALSQARAEAVQIALQGRGVDVSAITARGYGESSPIADNGTEEGREANRRIDFTLLGTAAVPIPAGTSAAALPGAAPVPEGAAPAGTAPAVEDDSPSVAPTEMTLRPRARPARDG